MSVKDRNPFGPTIEEPSTADDGVTNPFDRPQTVVRCPACDEKDPTKIGTHNTPSQILRTCKTCGNEWSCGSIGGAYMVPISEEDMRSPVVEEQDIPEDFRMSGTDQWFDD